MHNYNFSNASILIVGDIILDKYYFGRVNRISPEAPVPIVRVTGSKCSLGGASNVANNIAHLNGKSFLIGAVGIDPDKDILISLLDKLNIDHRLIETQMPTITKVRVVSEHQQLVRLDFEELKEIGDEYFNEIRTHIEEIIDNVNIVIISDYGKGLCSEKLCQFLINLANSKGKYVVVDPKGKNWGKYRNATMITPNLKELGEVAEEDIDNVDALIDKYGVQIMQKYNLPYLLVTRSDKGMSLITRNQSEHFPTEAREVYDVSGAGDTVIATLATVLSSDMNASMNNAVYLSNKAAGIVVSKFGTAPIERDELVDAFFDTHEDKKILKANTILQVVLDLKEKGKKIVCARLNLSVFTKKHVIRLRDAKKEGVVLIVVLDGRSFARKEKDREPRSSDLDDMVEILSSMEFVDYVIVNEGSGDNLISDINPYSTV